GPAAGQEPRAHVDRVPAVVLLAHALDAGARADRDVVPAGEAHEPEPLGEGREDAHAVAAHLGDRAVGVAVVHEPDGVRVLGEHLARLGDEGRRDEADDAVAPDAPAAVGERAHELGREVELALRVGDEHEVVAGPVALGEAGARPEPRLRRTGAPVSASSGSAPATGAAAAARASASATAAGA